MEQQAAIEKMIAELRSALAFKHMAIATEKSYVHWAKRYAWWICKHPKGTSEQKVRAYLTQVVGDSNARPID